MPPEQGIEVELGPIFKEHEFSEQQQVFYTAALTTDNPAISRANFVGNVDLAEAQALEKKGEIIGPPIGMAEFLGPLHEYLANGDQEVLSMLGTSVLEDSAQLIEEGQLGHYTTAPLMNVYRGALSVHEARRKCARLRGQLQQREISREEFHSKVREIYEKSLLNRPLPAIEIRDHTPDALRHDPGGMGLGL